MIRNTSCRLGLWVAPIIMIAMAPITVDAQVAESSKIIGVWNATAETDNRERSSVWKFQRAGDGFAGQYVSDDSDQQRELSNISFDGKELKFEMAIDAQGEQLLIKVVSKIDGKKIVGTWSVMSDENELASGNLSAVKKTVSKTVSNSVFDGSSLDSFRGYNEEAVGSGWKMIDGILKTDGSRSGDIITKMEFADFVLEFEWKISEGGNSGVMYRVSLGDRKPFLTGPEYQVLDDDKHKDGSDRSKSSGSLYGLYAPANKTVKPVGQWNTSRIVLDGKMVQHWLNGRKVVEAEIGSDDWNEKVAASKFKSWEKFGKNNKGHVCFQDHGNPVWFRNIKIKTLK